MAKAKEDAPSLFELLRGETKKADVVAKEGEGDKDKTDLIAVKCDVCFEREFAACVYNCPTTAIQRIDPRSYFDELRLIAPKLAFATAQTSGPKTTDERPSRWLDSGLQGVTLMISALIAWALFTAVKPTSWSGAGLYAGITAFVMILVLGMMGIRKRLRTQKLGSLAVWARAHAIGGGVLYGVVLFHSGFQATSTLTAALLGTLTLAVLSGVAGQIVSAIIPGLLSRTEDEALLPEDVVPRMKSLLEANVEYLKSVPEVARARVERHANVMKESGWSLLSVGVSAKTLASVLEKRKDRLPQLAENENAVALRIAENLSLASLFRARRVLELVLTSWVAFHLVATAMAMMLLLGHLMTVLLW